MSLGSLLRKLDSTTLRRLAGGTIVDAISATGELQTEARIAEVLIYKYRRQILQKREIRLALLDQLSPSEAKEFASKLCLQSSQGATPYSSLTTYFGTWSLKKSREFVQFFNLDPELISEPVADDREESQLLAMSSSANLPAKPFLHDYQKRVKDEVCRRLDQESTRFMVQMPTGAGKTYTALEAIVDRLRKPRRRRFIVWLVANNELCEQALSSFQDLWKLKGDHKLRAYRLFDKFEPTFNAPEGGVVFASFDKLRPRLNEDGTARSEGIRTLIDDTDALFVDEAHGSTAPTHIVCIQAFLRNPEIRVVGLSATPGRTSGGTAQLVNLYTGNIVGITNDNGEPTADPLGFLQREGYLAKLKFDELKTNQTVSEGAEDALLEKLANNRERNADILKQIQLAHDAKESTLVFACTLDHVFALSVMCRKAGIRAEVITGEVDPSDRLQILSEFKTRNFFILINRDLLAAGVDIPKLNRLIITRPVGSPILCSQILGRALRGPKNGGNAANTVVTVRDNLLNYPTANYLYNFYQGDWS